MGGRLVIVLTDYHYLCCNCGAITSFGCNSDSIWVCPKCLWQHTDDDANPGVYDGTLAELQVERARLAADPVYADLWAADSKVVPQP